MSVSDFGFKLRVGKPELQESVLRYRMPDEERRIENEIVPLVRTRGFYKREEFLTLCRWRSPRAVARCQPNDADFVRAATRIALGEAHERIRVGVLRLLRGVDWPTASVLLHFGHRDRYPVIDIRVLWSVGASRVAHYTFELWWEYVKFCRTLSDECGLSMRDLDRALWQYSKEHAPHPTTG